MELHGIWPAAITPMHSNGDIDYEGCEKVIEYYRKAGCHGAFALCLTSEIFQLDRNERVDLCRFWADHVGSMPWMVSGHVSDDFKETEAEFSALLDAGAPGIIMIANRLVKPEDDDDALLAAAMKLADRFPDTPFGIYECPRPYRRLLSPETLKKLADTGRFVFMKETSCDPKLLSEKIKAVQGSNLHIFNACAATLLQGLRDGSDGFCGIMANHHPDLYVRLYQAHANGENEFAQWLQDRLTLLAGAERILHPCGLKRYLGSKLGIEDFSRMNDVTLMRPSYDEELRCIHDFEVEIRACVRKHDTGKQ